MFTTFTVKNHQINSAHIIHIPRCLTFTIHLCYTTNMICVNNDMCDIYKICLPHSNIFDIYHTITMIIAIFGCSRGNATLETVGDLRISGNARCHVTNQGMMWSPWDYHGMIILYVYIYIRLYIYTFIYIYMFIYIYIYLCYWVYFILTSRRDRALESWFLLGKSSPNGRTIQVGEILQFTQMGLWSMKLLGGVRYGQIWSIMYFSIQRFWFKQSQKNSWSQKLYNSSDCNWGDGVEIANWKWLVLHNGLDRQRCLRDENHAAITVAAVVKSPKKSW